MTVNVPTANEWTALRQTVELGRTDFHSDDPWSALVDESLYGELQRVHSLHDRWVDGGLQDAPATLELGRVLGMTA